MQISDPEIFISFLNEKYGETGIANYHLNLSWNQTTSRKNLTKENKNFPLNEISPPDHEIIIDSGYEPSYILYIGCSLILFGLILAIPMISTNKLTDQLVIGEIIAVIGVIFPIIFYSMNSKSYERIKINYENRFIQVGHFSFPI